MLPVVADQRTAGEYRLVTCQIGAYVVEQVGDLLV